MCLDFCNLSLTVSIRNLAIETAHIHNTFYSVLCDDAGLMAQWSAADDTIDHHLIVITLSHASLHFVITPSSSHCRVIAASVLYRHHHRTIARLSSHYRAIASSTQICSDSLGSIRIPGIFLKFFFGKSISRFLFLSSCRYR